MTEFDVFDVHHHVGDAMAVLGELDPTASTMSRDDYEQLEVAKRIEIMDAGGVRQAAVIPGHGYARPNGYADTRAINDRIAAYRDANPARFPVAVGVVEPRDAELSISEVSRCKTELGLGGISFHTRFQGVSVDNHWVHRAVARMGEVGLLPVLHSLGETPDEALWKIAQIARSLPEVPMLVLDAYATFEGTKEVGFFAELAPSLHFDTSLSYNFDFIATHIERYGAERFVFGTDLYSWPLGQRISHIKAELLASDLDDVSKAAVLGGNARRLFGLVS